MGSIIHPRTRYYTALKTYTGIKHRTIEATSDVTITANKWLYTQIYHQNTILHKNHHLRPNFNSYSSCWHHKKHLYGQFSVLAQNPRSVRSLALSDMNANCMPQHERATDGSASNLHGQEYKLSVKVCAGEQQHIERNSILLIGACTTFNGVWNCK